MATGMSAEEQEALAGLFEEFGTAFKRTSELIRAAFEPLSEFCAKNGKLLDEIVADMNKDNNGS
jgi:hypothetical protein